MKLGIIATKFEADAGSAFFFDEPAASPPPRNDGKDAGRASGIFARPAPRPARPAAAKTPRRRR